MMLSVSWTGSAHTSNWGDANNWSTGQVPQAGEDVSISGATVQNATGSIGHLSVTNGTLSGTGAGLTVNGGATLINSSIIVTDVHGDVDSFGSSAFINGTLYGNLISTGSKAQAIYNMHEGSITLDAGSSLAVGGTLSDVQVNGDAISMTGNNSSLQNVTINGNVSIPSTISNLFRVQGGLVLNGTIGLNGGSSYSGLLFDGSQTLSGTGSVILSGSYSNVLAATGGTTLTIGGGITIQGKTASIGFVSGVSGVPDDSTIRVINNGTIQADGTTGSFINVDGTGNQNNGTLKSLNGGQLSLVGSITNAATMNIGASSSLAVSGTLTGGTISVATSAKVTVYGTLSGATISGGDYSLSGNGTGTLDAVTLIGNASIPALGSGGNLFRIRNGLVLNGTIGLNGGSSYSGLLFDGSQTLSGTGSVILSGSYSNVLAATGGTTLTIGGGITIQGKTASIGFVSGVSGVPDDSTIRVINNGIIQADGDKYSYINIDGIGNQNNGTLKALNGDSIYLVGSMNNIGNIINTSGYVLVVNGNSHTDVNNAYTQDGKAYLQTSAGATIRVMGDIIGTTQASTDFVNRGEVQIYGGTAGQPRLLEAMSEDRGPLGLTVGSNFYYDTIHLGSSSYVRIVDNAWNYPDAQRLPEVVYVRQLIVPAGSTLDLNGLKVYAQVTSIQGTVVGGTITAGTLNLPPTAIQLTNTITSLPENTDTSSPVRVADIQVTDDSIGTNSLILSGPNVAAFQVSNGKLYLKAGLMLDYEAQKSYSVTVDVDDPAVGKTPDATVDFALSLANINEVPTVPPQSVTVAENSAAGTVVATVTGTDPDVGQSLAYSLQSGNINGAFAIDSVTGQITVANPAALDFETTPIFSLTVQATDNGSPTQSGTAVVTVNLTNSLEATPSAVQVIVPMYQYPLSAPNVLNDWWQQVLDGATATTPLTIVANPASGPILPGNPDYANWVTGLEQLRTNPYIRILGYVRTRVSPGSSTVRTASDILTDVTAYAQNYKHSVSGASLIDGVFLDEMSNDAANVGTYSTVATGIRATNGLAGHFMVGNPGSPVPNEYLDQNTADMFIVREGTPVDLLGNATPGYVTSPTYSALTFGAVVHDASGSATLAQMLREIKLRGYDYAFVTDDGGANPYDQAPTYFSDLLRDIHAPYIAATSYTVPENSANDTVIGTPVSGDPDVGQVLSYSIVSGNTGNAFAINSGTGQVTVNNAAGLNFEANPTFSLGVMVTDNGNPSLNDTVTLAVALTDVNEAPTAVTLQNATTKLPENTSTVSRLKVADVVVTDDALGTNVLSLTGADAAAFEIFNGGLYIKAGTTLDFETKSQYVVTVRVDDSSVGATPDASANFALTLTDANDPPVIGGATANQPVNDNATKAIFSTLAIADPDTQAMSASVTILNGIVRGDFTPATTTGWTRTVSGNNIKYAKTFSSAANIGATVQAAVRAFVFQPRSNAIKPNTTETTAFAVTVSDGVASPVTNNTTSLVTTSLNDAPAFGGLAANLPVNDNTTINPLSGLAVADVDMQEMLISVTILNGKFRGDFSPASVVNWPVRYTTGNDITYKRYFSPQANVGAAAQAAFRALVFQPRSNAIKPGTTEATEFQVTVSDGVAPAVLGTGTRVTTTSVNDAPVIGGAVANQTINDNQTKAVFSTLTTTDPDTQDMLVKVTINNGTARGDFTAASSTGWTRTTSGANIVYARYFNPTTNIGATVQTAIRALVFQPRNNVSIGTSEATTFTVLVNDGIANVANSTTSVITTGVAPRIAPVASIAPPAILTDDITTVVMPTITVTKSNTLARFLKKPR